MAVTQYIGSRYVPVFEGEWDNTRDYEALTVVQHQGNSYTSRQPVPVGIEITNEKYWAETGNYNAQVEAYRREVQTFDDRITTNATNIAAEVLNRTNADTALSGDIAAEALLRSNADSNLQASIDDVIDDIDEMQLAGKYIGVIGDSFSTTNSFDYWPQILARKTGCTVINKATNGTGFTRGTSTTKFIGQLNSLAADEHWSSLKCIIVYGGVNDYNDNTPQTSATAAATATAINEFISAYENLENRPPLILAFGNVGKANRAQYNKFLSWYQLVRDGVVSTDAVIVDDVPYWLLPFNSFYDDLHPDAYGQHIVYKYMYKLLTGTYAGQHHLQQGTANNGKIKYTLNVDNGVVNLHLRFNDSVTIDNIATNSWNEVSNIISQPLMFGGDSAYSNLGAWCYSWPLFYGIDGANNQIGIIRPLFNASNGTLYLQMFGSASVLSNNSFTIGGDQEMQFTIFPTRGELL